MDITTVSKRAGHSKVGTTLNIYSHKVKSRDEAAANMLDDMVVKKLKSNSKRIDDK